LQMVRIDDVRRSESGDQDLLHYEVSVKDGSTWQPLCGDQPAIALPGTWDLQPGARGAAGWRDETGFFFACADSSVAKCYEMGFKPWKFQMEGDTVLNLHEACVRALRADFGGTGAAGTTNGVEVVLSTDRQAQTPPGFVLEAAWSVDGARCRLRERVEGMNPDLQAVPLCDEARLEDARNLLYSFTRDGSPAADPDLKFALSCDDQGASGLVDERGGLGAALRGHVGRTGDTPDGSGGACTFSGSDPGATFPPFDVGSTITISAWVKPESFEGKEREEARIISKTSGLSTHSHDWMLGFGQGRLRARIRTGGRTSTVLSHGQVDLGAWHHVAMTFDGAFIRLYIDGVLDRAEAKTGALSARSVNVGVGSQPVGLGNRGLDGAIDGLRVYGRALTDVEIARQAVDERAH
ncbi:MAG: ADYC domain-containing protein, partial [Myxococcota bacterium]